MGVDFSFSSSADSNMTSKGSIKNSAIKSFQLTSDALGYISSPLPFSEAFTAVQTGVVDGVIGGGAEGYYASFRDVTKTYVPINTHFEVWYMIINGESLADLDKEDQEALKKAAAEFEQKRWTTAEADQAKNEQKLAEYGAKVIKLSDAELSAAAQKVRAEVWPKILKDVGEDWGQNILDKIAKQ